MKINERLQEMINDLIGQLLVGQCYWEPYHANDEWYIYVLTRRQTLAFGDGFVSKNDAEKFKREYLIPALIEGCNLIIADPRGPLDCDIASGISADR